MNQFTEQDLDHLHLFRSAASQVRDASLIAQGKRALLKVHRADDGDLQLTHELLEPEAFKALAVSVRLVYQSGEPAHFGHICNILSRVGPAEIASKGAALRAAYNGTLNDHNPLLAALALRDKATYTPRDVLETWLYSVVLHQDPARRADYEALSALGDSFAFTVQSIVLRLAGRIMDLDDLVADAIDEPPLPRIQTAGA